MKRIRVARSAIADLDEIWIYVAQRDGEAAAQKLVESLVRRFGLLSKHPDAGRNRSELSPSLRIFPVGRYRIYYRVDSRFVRILHVRHVARDEGTLSG
jgi:toxin ParE1/3/4